MKKEWMILTVVILFVGIFLTPGCKTMEEGFDIRGTWNILEREGEGDPGQNFDITFNGDQDQGTVTSNHPNIGIGSGTFLVNENRISFSLTYKGGKITVEYGGVINNDTHMAGEWNVPNFKESGLWETFR